MTYTGNVHVGGDPAVRELTGLVVEKLAVGEMNNNAYLLRCRSTRAISFSSMQPRNPSGCSTWSGRTGWWGS